MNTDPIGNRVKVSIRNLPDRAKRCAVVTKEEGKEKISILQRDGTWKEMRPYDILVETDIIFLDES